MEAPRCPFKWVVVALTMHEERINLQLGRVDSSQRCYSPHVSYSRTSLWGTPPMAASASEAAREAGPGQIWKLFGHQRAAEHEKKNVLMMYREECISREIA
ncbi:hypothetical protein IF1G_07649 [Cordyceps javanica]|uniref:Uncharacterized protein n=1 Tax=Cordyceps javanica TaxID=43265 RepID=A0A545UWT0_9HYPO|nr:hypothetical protein IF1G_07649 [Cordyceps javanica]